MGFLETIKNWLLDFDNKEPFNAAQDFNVAIVGFVIVMAALFLLIFLVYLLSFLLKDRKSRKIKTADNTPGSQDDVIADNAKLSSETVLNVENDSEEEDEEELIAVLTAAIMASYGTQTECNLRITSFRRINNNSPSWNTAGRRDNLDSSL